MSSQSSHQTRNDIQPKKVARFTDQNEVFEYSDQKQNSDDSDLLLSPMH